MATMTEHGSQRQNNSFVNKLDFGYANRNTSYSQPAPRPTYNQMYGAQQGQAHAGMAALAHGVQGMNVQDSTFASQAKNAMMTAAVNQYNAMPLGNGMPAAFWGPNGQLMFSGAQAYPGSTQYPAAAHQHSPGMYTPLGSQYMSQGYSQPQYNSPGSQWTPSQATGEVPTLITPRRDSISSNENDAPGTPSYAGYPGFHQGGIAIINRSPNGVYTASTPSPSQMMTPYGMPMGKLPDTETIPARLRVIVTKEPAIPQAIPAPSSPLKPLDRALENIRGETNVYIRGLLPETSDDMLENWGRRFGDIKSSKSILDHQTGMCKGFGFVRYHNYKDAEDCIRGFHYLGYEVSFARESFYSKLKAVADDDNTNLYVSNLPKSMNEHELATIFEPHKVCSARILRDKNGTGRGVGFARFESRTVCDEIIKSFNNRSVEANGEEHIMQIRFADTQEQKHLKQTTAAARQFRSAEYEYATQVHKTGWVNPGQMQYAPTGQENAGQGNEFEAFLGTTPGVPIQGQRWAQSALRNNGRSPLAVLPQGTNSQHTNVRAGNAASNVGVQTQARKDVEADPKPTGTSTPTIARGDNSPTASLGGPEKD